MPDDSAQTETELKFIVSPERLDALRAAMQGAETRTQRLEAVYVDTPSDRLARHAVALRVRKEGERWVQTAKALTADPFRRHEHNVDREAAAGGGAPAFDLALHDGTPVGAAIRAALDDAHEDGNDLVERFRTEVSRTTRLEAHAGAVIELALDTGQVRAGARTDAICELEFEWKSGPVQALFDVASTWAGAHGLWLSSVTKAERGQRLLQGVVHGEPVHAAPPVVDAGAGLPRFVAAVLNACLAQVLANASEVAAGAGGRPQAADVLPPHPERDDRCGNAASAHEEFVHQLRVGLRRLRTALRQLGDALDGLDPTWEPALRDAFQRLGDHRDAVAIGATLTRELTDAGFADALPDDLAGGDAPDPGAVVRDPAFQAAVLGLLACSQPSAVPSAPRKRSRHRLKRQLAKRLARLHTAVLRDVDRFEDLDAERQHLVRKRLKRLRYLAEFTAPVFGTRAVERFLKRWRAAQDALGENNDLWVGIERLRSAGTHRATVRPPVRWLRERQRACARRCERRLRGAARGKVFWD